MGAGNVHKKASEKHPQHLFGRCPARFIIASTPRLLAFMKIIEKMTMPMSRLIPPGFAVLPQSTWLRPSSSMFVHTPAEFHLRHS